MLVLGIETSGFEGSIALLQNQTCLGERILNQEGRRHAQSLVSEIRDLLQDHDLTPQSVQAVAVSRGPGSFTGLRVGMVCAKTFAYATGSQFVAVDTFSIIAENVPQDVTKVFVIEDAQRDDLFVGEFERNESLSWSAQKPIHILSVSDFLQIRSHEDLVVGPGLKKILPKAISLNCLPEKQFSQPKASIAAELGRRELLRHHNHSSNTDFWKAVPFYLRMSAAEEKRAMTDGNCAQ